jgi:FlaA1/EpsC-like NDP-sugar epimerase
MKFTKTIFITGGAGSISGMFIRTVSSHFKDESVHIIALDNDDTDLYRLQQQFLAENHTLTCVLDDIISFSTLEKHIDRYRPDFIFHSAAHKQVSLVEEFPERTFLVNTEASLRLFLVAKRRGIPVVFLSSDKAVEPNGLLGLSKWFAECAFLEWAIPGCVIRLPNLWDSKGSFFVEFPDIYKNKGFIPLTDKKASRYLLSEQTISSAFVDLIQDLSLFNGTIIVPYSVPERNVYEFLLELMKDSNVPESALLISGLRDGEKLREKLFWDEERMVRILDSQFVGCSETVMNWENMDLASVLDLNGDYEDQIEKLREMFLKF